MVRILAVLPNSYAAKVGIFGGDTLISINGHEINDVLDYRFYLTDCEITLDLTRKDQSYTVTIRKEEDDDIGLEFETPLMDKKHTCANRCVFCFIDQLPKGLRASLYFKDDDDRLSFLHGNYITLTNLRDRDVDRILKMHISPVNVSVHTTNPELRVRMMKNRRAGEVLSYLRTLADGGITLCTQIVLCKGLNDGDELDRSMHDLAGYYPALRSCSVVPVGLSAHRQGLYPLEPFTPEDCAAVIAQVNRFGDECLEKYGTRLFFCADEFYIRAGIPVPDEDYYEGYSQIENGVGMLTSLSTEFHEELQYLDELLPDYRPPRVVSVATGAAAYDSLCALSRELASRVPGLTVKVYRIINYFFGESITVAGLLTGKDISEQLAGEDLGDELLIPATMLRADGDIFLDDLTPADLSARLGGIRVTPTESDGRTLICRLLGIPD